jgi:hypothetical protein
MIPNAAGAVANASATFAVLGMAVALELVITKSKKTGCIHMVSETRRNLLLGTALAAGASAIATRPAAASIDASAPYQSLASFGAIPGNSSFDCTPAFNAALAQRVRNLYVPQGSWYFLSPPQPITYPISIYGDGFGASTLVRRYVPFSNTDGLLTVRASNCRISRIGVAAGAATSGGAGIALLADAAANPDFSVIEDVYVSIEHEHPGTWAYAIAIDGTARTAAPIGARSISLRNCFLFASTEAACLIRGGVSVSIRDGGLFPAAGNTGRLVVTGTDEVRSYYVNVDMGYLGGLSADNCKYLSVRAAVIAGDIVTARSAEDSLILGHCSGRVANSWTRGVHIDTQNVGQSNLGDAGRGSSTSPPTANRTKRANPLPRRPHPAVKTLIR